MNRVFILVAIFITCGGCASIQISSQADPNLPPPAFDRVLVAAPSADLELQQRIELSLTQAGQLVGVTIVPFHSVFLPGRRYEDEEILEIFERHRVQAVLVLRDETTASPTVVGSSMTIPSCESGAGGLCTPWSGGMAIASARAQQDQFTIAADLFDLRSHDVVWVGTAQIKRQGASDRTMIKQLSEDLIEALLNDRAIQPGSL